MTTPPKDEILEQAAHWYVILNDEQCTQEQRQQWQAWLSAHPDHQQAWQMVEQIHDDFSAIHQLTQHDDEKDAIAKSLMTDQQISRRTLFSLIGILFLGAGIAYQQRENIYVGYLRTRSSEYTPLGVREHLNTTQGFEYWLNTQTIIRQPSAYQIELLLGEIFIKTSLRLAQPLMILSNHLSISSDRAQFGIRKIAEKTVLAVVSGEVKLNTPFNQTVLLKAGQQITATANRLGQVLALQTYQYSWIKGILAADNMPLSQWATEMQRYHAEKIQVSPKADELQVVGLFPLDDLEQSLAMLRNVLPISTRRSGWNGILIDVSA
ncbi:MAG: DUF4880 domain-containing protein [Acinetobacter populi]|jgi:transmembrane sensor|uniref:DUF4880 domain-containing protein n=1 Tax=Acinetobacter populi TaxID=1582270 RepID=UPI002351FF91|nr:DUF4880 domain-containing protein [Acinetobacter populi]MCH4247060.1 DUF4880 domain-containing protein [Acinetobacter populi]